MLLQGSHSLTKILLELGLVPEKELVAEFERALGIPLAAFIIGRQVSDPMSGFFMIRHEAFVECVKAGVSGVGFKILLDLFATSPTPLRYRELPYQFRNRLAGESKLDSFVIWEFALLLADQYTIEDTWNVVGLTGSGSNDVLLDGAFVPDHRLLDVITTREAQSPGGEHNEGDLFNIDAALTEEERAIRDSEIGRAHV